ncbi:MAG: type IV secretory system conjugative DNA transfer family protein [Deltaproteobacteria bacterium]|nr:type IV secretory system conjugative DNA transfer family protein [Deltaproteobacteria bacterium]
MSSKESDGLILGRLMDRNSDTDPRYRVGGHVLTCAPTGTGKGIGCVIPNLLTYPGSVFCLDLKGENFAVTARRRRELGPTFALDPFGLTGSPSCAVNWLDLIDLSSPESVSDAASLADTLVVRGNGTEGGSYWNDAAANLIQGLLLHIASLADNERNPGTLRALLTLPERKLLGLLQELGEDSSTAFGVPARTANMFLAKADRDRSGVLSTAQQHTAFLDDPRIVETLKQSYIDFKDMKAETQTLFLVVPPDKLTAYSRYVRATIGLALKAMVREKTPPKNQVLFLLDEVAQLGRFSPIEDGISILRGYGVRLWLLVQDLSQLSSVYPKWRTFLANSVLQVFGTQDQQTAKYISDALGRQTIVYSVNGHSSSTSDSGGSSGSSTSYQHHGRELMTADEVRRLPANRVIVLEQGVSPQLLRRLDYRADNEFEGLFDRNPMYGEANRD